MKLIYNISTMQYYQEYFNHEVSTVAVNIKNSSKTLKKILLGNLKIFVIIFRIFPEKQMYVV